jgi:hypothetical protein
VITAAPLWNGAALVRAQASPVIALVESEAVETRETGSPIWGIAGNHLNEASGGASVGVGVGAGVTAGWGSVIVNVAAPLRPLGFPDSALSWIATAVY